jgi:hypothetical protein
MRQRTRVNYIDGLDDPFGSSFILPAEHADVENKPIARGSGAATITTNIVPIPHSDLNILISDYQVDDIIFGYDNLDIYKASTTDMAVQPAYSTAAAILSLFGGNQ